jgi:ring-1,2-phenylacetyl-CoA epoxidase subunit PaaA
VDATVPQAEILGLRIPDPNLKWNKEIGHCNFIPINWDEIWQVVNGPISISGFFLTLALFH